MLYQLRIPVPDLARIHKCILLVSAGVLLSSCTYVNDLRSRGVLPDMFPAALDGTMVGKVLPWRENREKQVTQPKIPQLQSTQSLQANAVQPTQQLQVNDAQPAQPQVLTAPQLKPPSNPDTQGIAAVTNRLNQERLPRNLAAMNVDQRLMKAAQNHAQYMAQNGVFGHEFGPETKFQKRIFTVGFKNSAGENIGVGYQNLEAAMVGWMNSEGHRKNMLKPNYDLFGIAYSRNKSGKNPQYDHFWVLIMGQGERRQNQVVSSLPPV